MDLKSLPEYQYEQLSSPRGIRVLELQPGPKDEPIICNLKPASLPSSLTDDESPEYDALSYVWGDKSNPVSIRCGKGVIKVTRNLHVALLHLRDETVCRDLWVDAICINQQNTAERKQQVQIMGEIYRNAMLTVIWLGEETDDTSGWVDSISALQEQFPNDDSREQTPFSVNAMAHLMQRLTIGLMIGQDTSNQLMLSPLWNPLVALFHRPWFHRKWVIQEAALSRNAFVTCGNESIPWSEMADLIMSLRASGLWGSIIPFQLNLEAQIGARNAIFMAANRNNAPSIEQLMLISTDFKCEDQRDHIIALLGLATDTNSRELGLRINYDHSTAVMFKEFALWRMQHNSIDFFSWSAKSNIIGGATLPSWVPNFADMTLQSTQLLTKNFTASGNSSVFATCKDGVKLLIAGKIVDEIILLSNVPYVGLTEKELQIASTGHLGSWKMTVRRWQDWINGCKGIACLKPNEWSEIWRTIVWDHSLGGRATEKLGKELLKFFDTIEFVGDLEVNWDPSTTVALLMTQTFAMNQCLSAYAAHKLLCLTADKRLASIPETAQPGDKICIFLGGHVPYVIRPCGNDGYSLVGPCYLHGVMDGELKVEQSPGEIITLS